MNRKKILTISAVIIVIIAAVITWTYFNGTPAKDDESNKSSFTTEEALPGSVSIKVEGPSIIEPFQTRNIRSRIEGIITFAPEEGDSIQEGQTLISIDGTDIQRSVNQAEINLSKARLNMERTISSLQNAKNNLEDTKQLFNSGAVSGEQLTAAQLAVDTAQFNLNSSRLDVAQAELTLEYAEKDLESVNIRAPFTGVVLEISTIPGDMVSKGTSLLTFADLSRVRLKAEVDEFDIGKVKTGQKVAITSDSLGDQTLGSKIEKVSPGAEIVNNISIFTVSTVLDNKEGILKPGMSADMSILIAADKGLVIPSKAVTSVRTRSYIKVLENGEVVTKKVEVGADDGRNIVVLEGIEEGTLVVIPGAPGLQLTSTSSVSSGTSVIPVQIPGSGAK